MWERVKKSGGLKKQINLEIKDNARIVQVLLSIWWFWNENVLNCMLIGILNLVWWIWGLEKLYFEAKLRTTEFYSPAKQVTLAKRNTPTTLRNLRVNYCIFFSFWAEWVILAKQVDPIREGPLSETILLSKQDRCSLEKLNSFPNV